MLNLDQVRLLENRVEKAVGKIQSLTAENTHLRSQLGSLQARVNELEGLVRAFKDDQGRIEEGILNALDRLSAFEESVLQQEKGVINPATQLEPTSFEPMIKDEAQSELPVHPETIDEQQSSESETIEDGIVQDDTDKIEIVSENLDIAADWQAPPVSSKSSSDGQMDIF